MSKISGADEDLSWVQEILAGNEDAFRNLYRKYRPRIYGLCFRFTRSDQDLDDLCQEVFVRAYQKLEKFRAEAPFEHWLLRIASNCCYDWLRKSRNKRKIEFSMDTPPEILDTPRMKKPLSREQAL